MKVKIRMINNGNVVHKENMTIPEDAMYHHPGSKDADPCFVIKDSYVELSLMPYLEMLADFDFVKIVPCETSLALPRYYYA